MPIISVRDNEYNRQIKAKKTKEQQTKNRKERGGQKL